MFKSPVGSLVCSYNPGNTLNASLIKLIFLSHQLIADCFSGPKISKHYLFYELLEFSNFLLFYENGSRVGRNYPRRQNLFSFCLLSFVVVILCNIEDVLILLTNAILILI